MARTYSTKNQGNQGDTDDQKPANQPSESDSPSTDTIGE